jgi:recombination protein RecR
VFEGPVQDLIDELGRLPGVGPKSAQRIAFHLLAADPADVSRLQEVLQQVKEGVRFCDVCGNVSERERCRFCSDARRDPTLVCVVEEPKDVLAVERTREFRGRYHVLGGALDPLAGIGPDALRIRELLTRLGGTGPAPDETEIAEVIIATDPNTEGEATATYLVRLLRDFPGLSVTRLASGLPMGGDLEFADELTLGRALSGRRALYSCGGRTPQSSCRGPSSSSCWVSQFRRRSRAIRRQVGACSESTTPTTIAMTAMNAMPAAMMVIMVTTCRGEPRGGGRR